MVNGLLRLVVWKGEKGCSKQFEGKKGEKGHIYPPENFLYKMGCLKALTCMSFCSERLFFFAFYVLQN